MSAQIIDGKALAAATKAEAAAEAAALKAKGIEPCLAVILVGENPASQVYVRGKVKDCGECGIKSLELRMPETTTQSPGRVSVTFRPLYTVTPAHSTGATAAKPMPAGRWPT